MKIQAAFPKAIFNGNGYSPEWPIEAKARGIPNLHNTPLALETFNSDKNKEVFDKLGVFTPKEVLTVLVCFIFTTYTHKQTQNIIAASCFE